MADWLTGKVIEKIQWNERLFSLRIRCDFSGFQSGQFVRVALDIDGERVARPYSLVNVPEDDHLEIYFNIVEEGPLSPRLAALQVDDEIFVTDSANGFLTEAELPPSRYLWMFATGTGIGPFLSILKGDSIWQRFERIVLGYSVRESSELCYQQEIADISSRQGDKFVYVPFITREKAEGALSQRITPSIEDGSLEAMVGLKIDEDSHVMMCGNSGMIADVTDVLVRRGMRKHRRREPGHITTEKYH